MCLLYNFAQITSFKILSHVVLIIFLQSVGLLHALCIGNIDETLDARNDLDTAQR